MKLLEIVSDKTSKSVVASSLAIAKKIQKIAAVVGVCPGFVGNRSLLRDKEKLINLSLSPSVGYR